MSENNTGTWFLVVQEYDRTAPDPATALQRGLRKIDLGTGTEAEARATAARVAAELFAAPPAKAPDGRSYPSSFRLVHAIDLNREELLSGSEQPTVDLPPGAVEVLVDYETPLAELLTARGITVSKRCSVEAFDEPARVMRRMLMRDIFPTAERKNGDRVICKDFALPGARLRPATLRELLAFSAVPQATQPLVALGFKARAPYGSEIVPVLHRNNVDYGFYNSPWPAGYHFLAVYE